MEVFADLHIHIGKSRSGRPIKITASSAMTIANILDYCLNYKGLQLIGLVDCAGTVIQKELGELITEGILREIDAGGLAYYELVLLLGSEVELSGPRGGAAHFIAYFPDLKSIRCYSREIRPFVTNMELSTQKLAIIPDTWVAIVQKFEGIIVAAHAFTPHKGVYGACVPKLGAMFSDPGAISALELGLSCDTEMVSTIADTDAYPYLTNSDAHSLPKIAREYTQLKMCSVDFNSWKNCLAGNGGQIIGNYGLHPCLGKYHRSFCPSCNKTVSESPPIFTCPTCERTLVYGVLDKIVSLSSETSPGQIRPPYFRQIPLEFIPGIGPRLLRRLLATFGTELRLMHQATQEELVEVVGPLLAERIILGREGKLALIPGGGGKYGRVKKE